MKSITVASLMIQALACAWTAQSAVTFDWATIGNPGNADDNVGHGYGGVDYTYRISKHEVTAGQYTEFLNAVASSDPNGLYNTNMWSDEYGCKIERLGDDGRFSYQVAPDRENRPVNFVSFVDSIRFANWLHNRQPTDSQAPDSTEHGAYLLTGFYERSPNATYFIPTEDEWYKAAYHKNDGATGNYWQFPTSSDTPPGHVDNSGNLSGVGSPFVEGGTDPGNYATQDVGGPPVGIGGPYYMTEVGEWENSASPYGTFDQGGNVWEWNETLGIYSGGDRGRRGGVFNNYWVYMRSDDRRSYLPGVESSGLGFRVASVPEPSTILLGAFFSALLLLRQRERQSSRG